MINYDVAIIGNGILGLSTAFFLSEYDKNIKILVIGKDERVGSASCAAGAMINHIGEVTCDTLKNRYSTKKLEVSIQANKMWLDWIKRLNTFLPNEQAIKYVPGTSVILNAKSGSIDCENYAAIIQAASIYSEEINEIDPKEVSGLKPLDDCRPLKALYLPNEGSVDSTHLVNSLVNILQMNSNITFVNENASKINSDTSNATSITLCNEETIKAEKIVLAAGSYSQLIIDKIPELAKRIPRLLAGVGISAVVSQSSANKIKHVIRTPNRSGACGLHVVPRDESSLYIGATNNIAFSPTTDQKLGLSQFLLQCAIDQIDQDLYSSKILSWSVGNRPVTVDTFPIIGPTSIENLFILTGTYRDGLQQSPFWGEYMAKTLLGMDTEFDNPFRPERDLLQAVNSKEEAIKEVVRHYMCGFYEHGMQLPRLFPEQRLEELLYKKFESIYEKLGTEFPLKPDILFLFEISDDNENNMEFFRKYFTKS